MKNAILIVDVQKFFINKFTKDIPKKITIFLNKKKFDFVLFSKFIFSRKSSFAKFIKKPRLINQKDIDIVSELKKFITKNNVFTKSTFSSLKSKQLLNFLKKNKVGKLYLCGLDTNACVLATAVEAFDLGFDVKVLEDLCGSHSSKKYHKNAVEILKRNARDIIINSKEVTL
jgi:nicotinamidase-related amidase